MFEDILSNPTALAGLTLIGRNVFGWLSNSLKDGEIQRYEWEQLAKTLFTLGGLALFLFYGINAVVPGISGPDAAAMAALIDVLKSQFKKE